MIDAVPLRTEEQMGFAGECLQKKPYRASPELCKLSNANAKRLKTERNGIMQSSNGRKSGKYRANFANRSKHRRPSLV